MILLIFSTILPIVISNSNFGEYLGDHTYLKYINNLKRFTHVYKIPEKQKLSDRRRLAHTWDDYIWKKTSNHLIITIGDCSDTSSINWSNMLVDVVDNWNNVPENQDGTGEIYSPANASMLLTSCDSAPMIKFYNANSNSDCSFDDETDCYGNNNILGINYIWTDNDNIILKSEAFINEYYLDNYSENQWNHVLCHEIGHGWPLGHQSESGDDTNSCMDYSYKLDNKYPNKHDVEVIDYLYSNATLTNNPNNNNKNKSRYILTFIVYLFFSIASLILLFCLFKITIKICCSPNNSHNNANFSDNNVVYVENQPGLVAQNV